jgi:hypothetical protein
MKKLLVTLLILGIAGGAFAQAKITVTADLNPEIMRISSPTGNAANKEYNYSSGTADILSSSANGTMGQENALNIAVDWAGEAFVAHLRINAEKLFRPSEANGQGVVNQGGGHTGTATDNTNHSFVNLQGKTPNLSDFLTYSMDEWYVRGTTGFFTAYVGNTGDRGKTDRFQDFDGFLKAKVDSFGLLTPDANVASGVGATYGAVPIAFLTDPEHAVSAYKTQDGDNNNLQRRFRLTTTYRRWDDMPYWALTLNFADLIGLPLFFQVAGDIGYNTGIGAPNGTSGADTNRGYNNVRDYFRMNGAVRVSGQRLADLISFDAIYRFQGGDADTLDQGDGTTQRQPDGEGSSVHTFGVYANVWAIKTLGIAVGYTGQFRTYEDSYNSTTRVTTTTTAPFFQGIDLRLKFTGIDKLTITFNNNFTVAFADGSSVTNENVVGLNGQIINEEKQEQSWYALYNALAISYQLSTPLKLSFQIGNILTMSNISNSATNFDYEYNLTSNRFSGTIFAAYKFNSFVLLQSGLQFLYDTGSTKSTFGATNGSFANKAYDNSAGMMYFAIPVRMQVVY